MHRQDNDEHKPLIPLHPPLKPRQRQALRVPGIARISTKNQDDQSLEDQVALYR